MTLSSGLGRQIAISMVAATLATLLVAIVSIYLFYGIVARFAPQLMPVSEAWFPRGIEWLLIIVLCIVGISLAVVTSIRLAARIVEPLTAVAATARLITRGNLSARVVPLRRSLGEASQLVEDFNAMAHRLESASEEISRWNATIAHELRTPVTILKGRLQGLAEGVFRPEEALFLSLLGQVDGLARLIEDLRTLSLFESGHLHCRFDVREIGREVEDVVTLIEPNLTAAGFEVTTAIDPGEAEIDAARIRQALLALLENARRHATAGRLLVSLQLVSDRMQLKVTDVGPGLPPEFALRAFRPFERNIMAESAVPGTGLGLAVVKAVAEAHDGRVFYTATNGGSCFTIDLPRWVRRRADIRAPS